MLNSEEDFSNSGIEQKLQGSIEFSRVSFAYPNGSGLLALRDVSFKINAGENIGIMGNTGYSKGVHLHYGWSKNASVNGEKINPIEIENMITKNIVQI